MRVFMTPVDAPPLAILLLVSFMHAVAADNLYQLVQFSLLFPRNETFGTTSCVPVVFSISNSRYANVLVPNIDLFLYNLTAG